MGSELRGQVEGTVKLSRICPFCGRILLDHRLRINDLAVVAGGENAAKLLNLTVPAAPRGCFDLPVEQRDQRGPFHLPRDYPRGSHSRPHALHGGVDHHAVEAEARRPREVRRRFALAREPVRPVGVPSEIVQQGPVMQLDRISYWRAAQLEGKLCLRYARFTFFLKRSASGRYSYSSGNFSGGKRVVRR